MCLNTTPCKINESTITKLEAAPLDVFHKNLFLLRKIRTRQIVQVQMCIAL